MIKSDYLYSYGFINAAVEDKFLLNLYAVKLSHFLLKKIVFLQIDIKFLREHGLCSVQLLIT